MFYRRTLVLAVVEMCGGGVDVAPCQALLALFCAHRKKNYYDFFHSYSGYESLVLAQDKHRLTDLGLLEDVPSFQLRQAQEYLKQLTPLDQRTLLAVHAEYKDLSLAALFSPQIQMFDKKAVSPSSSNMQTQTLPNTIEAQYKPCLFTLGYEGLTIDAYLNLLEEEHIALLVDIRRNPLSRKYGFSKKQLAQATSLASIEYLHLPELGIPSALRQHLVSEQDYRRLFDHYAKVLLPERYEAMARIKRLLLEKRRLALMCFEADPQFCHRQTLVDTLQADPTFHDPVVHLTGKNPQLPEHVREGIRKDVHGNSTENSVYIIL